MRTVTSFSLLVLLNLYGVALLYASYIGITFHLGWLWAGVAIIVALQFYFAPPLIIGAFFAAIDVWHWHWLLAALFVAPGLTFMIPGVMKSMVRLIRE